MLKIYRWVKLKEIFEIWRRKVNRTKNEKMHKVKEKTELIATIMVKEWQRRDYYILTADTKSIWRKREKGEKRGRRPRS